MERSDARSAAVLAANEAFYRAFNQKDPVLMEQMWVASDQISCIHPGWNVLQGHHEVLESWRAILNNPNQPRIVTGAASVSFIANVALVICRELVAGSPLVATNLFIEHNGSWRLLHHQSGSVFSPA